MALSRAAAGLLRPLSRRAAALPSSGGGGVRAASDLPKELLPGPYPKTPEERAAAAKKYNLRLEDYEPYPDDGMGMGDYPKLPDRSQLERDHWYNWDHPGQRRNHGEPLHWDFDMYINQRVDTTPTVESWHVMRNWLLGFVGFMVLMFVIGEIFPSYRPVAPKQYPDKESRVKHYEI